MNRTFTVTIETENEPKEGELDRIADRMRRAIDHFRFDYGLSDDPTELDLEADADLHVLGETEVKVVPADLEIAKMLVLSTAHVSKQTANLLDLGGKGLPPFFEKGGYGWLVHVRDDPAEEDPRCPADLQRVIDFARAQGCQWVCLDRDGEEIDGLPWFKW